VFLRPVGTLIEAGIKEPRRFIQALIGPRQTGKTTLVRQVMAELPMPSQYASADEPMLRDRVWVEEQWEIARSRLKADSERAGGLLVLDEIQKVTGWSERQRPFMQRGHEFPQKSCSQPSYRVWSNRVATSRFRMFGYHPEISASPEPWTELGK
jgi:hypothetical protein